MSNKKPAQSTPDPETERDPLDNESEGAAREQLPPEIGGPRGKGPTRYGDWEKNGRCIDF